MLADSLEARGRLVGQFKVGLMENASVIIASLAVLISAGALLFGGVAMYIAFDAVEEKNELKTELRLYQYHVDSIHADLTAHGFEPPPLPEK